MSARRRTAGIATLIFTLCFGVYGMLGSPRLQGYEGETAAIAEGIARGYGARVPPDSKLVPRAPPTIAKLVRERGRTGILQPVLMVPFYAVGAGIDEVLTGGDDYTYRSFVLRLYSAAVTALCAAMLFLLVRALGRSEGWAIALALAFAFASLALPYAGIGMEPTGTLVVMAAFLVATYASRSGSLWLWALTGAMVGVAASTKPSNALPALGALVLLWPGLRDAGRAERRRLVAALALPIVLGAITYLGYNLYRFDDPFETGYQGLEYGPGKAPFAALGLYLSPGKGLAWYSPLAIIGLLGLIALWRRERTLAIAIVAGMALGTLPYLTAFWSDDTWGPRYLVPVAWLLLLPIAWWATTKRRRLIAGGVLAVAIWVQLAGTLVGFGPQTSALLYGYTGVKVYGPYVGVPEEEIPYGDDPIRWVPELSPLLFNSEALVSIAARNVGLPDRESEYEPFRGRNGSVDLATVPLDVWWNPGAPRDPAIPRPSALWLLPFGLLAAGSALGLRRLGAGRPDDATSA
jgi:hypothetical protein